MPSRARGLGQGLLEVRPSRPAGAPHLRCRAREPLLSISPPDSATPAAASDLINSLKALPDCRMRRGIRFPQWWMLLAVLDATRADGVI